MTTHAQQAELGFAALDAYTRAADHRRFTHTGDKQEVLKGLLLALRLCARGQGMDYPRAEAEASAAYRVLAG